jgi:hypothetical protein
MIKMKAGNVYRHQTVYCRNILGLKFEANFETLILFLVRCRLYWLHQGVKFTLIFLFLWLCWLTTRTVFQLGGETATATVGKKFIA